MLLLWLLLLVLMVLLVLVLVLMVLLVLMLLLVLLGGGGSSCCGSVMLDLGRAGLRGRGGRRLAVAIEGGPLLLMLGLWVGLHRRRLALLRRRRVGVPMALLRVLVLEGVAGGLV